MSIYYKDLNPEQLAAVNAGGNVLITACPGSGKTRVITHKLAFELDRLPSTKRLLIALTFTNRAADEIKRRIERLSIQTDNLWTGTIHSFCLEWIIRPYGGYLPEITAGFSIADEIESEEIIDGLKSKYGINRFANIKRIYNIDGGFDTNERRFIPLIQEYKDIIHANRKIDFDDILYYAYKLVKTHPVIALRLSGLFELICVDEYQDTQELQYSILAEIVKSQKNKTRIFLVGDVCQAIYGSIGGIAKSRAQIVAQFGGIGVNHLTLTGNYRSTQRMVDYYSNYQVEPIEIDAVSAIAYQIGTIAHDVKIHKDDVHIVISKLIRQTIDQGVPAEEICVMAPQWWMILPMGRKLKSLLPDVDFDAVGLSPFRKVRENIWFKVLRLFLTTPRNSNYSIRYQWTGEVLAYFEEVVPAFLAGIENKKRHLLRTVNKFKSGSSNTRGYVAESLDYFIGEFLLTTETHPELEEKRAVFDKVLMGELDREQFDFANDINVLKRVFNSKSGVVVSTCHGVKGEEYDTVIAFGLLDGYIPNWNDPDDLAANKLLYVICSRAKRYLYLFSERGYLVQGKDRRPTDVLTDVKFHYDKLDD